MPAAWVSAGVAIYNASNQPDPSSGASGNLASGSNAVSQAQWNYFVQNYQPLESNLINQAATAGSPEEFARARGAANADVTGSFDQARKATTSRLASYGINPGSPAFQSSMASSDLAEGATRAGALTAADINTRNLAYSKALDVTGLGRGIPAQSAASMNNSANAMTAAQKQQFAQNQINTQNTGRAVTALGNAAAPWFNNTNSAPAYNSTTSAPGGYYYAGNSSGADTTGVGGAPYAKGGRVTRYARGGIVGHKGPITPHMRHFAGGGGVGRQGLEAPDRSDMGATIDNETGKVIGQGNGTSDSIPAEIDGQKPAALSTGEFVMNAEVPKLSGDEILEAINDAGLKKRQRAGLGPRNSNEASPDAGSEAYAEGGGVQADVRRSDRFRPSEMPSSERRRLANDHHEDFMRKGEAVAEDVAQQRSDAGRQKAFVSAADRAQGDAEDRPHQYADGGQVDGMVEPATITNLYDRKILNNPDGSYSTTSSMSFNEDGKEVLIPTVVDGARLSQDQAINHYRKTGEHLGKFSTSEAADAYAEKLHNDQAAYVKKKGLWSPSAAPQPVQGYRHGGRVYSSAGLGGRRAS